MRHCDKGHCTLKHYTVLKGLQITQMVLLLCVFCVFVCPTGTHSYTTGKWLRYPVSHRYQGSINVRPAWGTRAIYYIM